MFNLPNNLTLLRIFAIPIIVALLYFPNKMFCLLAMLVFIAASLTDLFDGIIARRFNLVTTLGKFLDPLADKLLITSVLVMLVQLGWLEAWIAILIIGREMSITGLRAMAMEKNLVIAADKYGKLKTITQVIAICPLVLHFTWFGFDPRPVGLIFIYIALVLAIFSGANYFYRFFSSLHMQQNEKV